MRSGSNDAGREYAAEHRQYKGRRNLLGTGEHSGRYPFPGRSNQPDRAKIAYYIVDTSLCPKVPILLSGCRLPHPLRRWLYTKILEEPG